MVLRTTVTFKTFIRVLFSLPRAGASRDSKLQIQLHVQKTPATELITTALADARCIIARNLTLIYISVYYVTICVHRETNLLVFTSVRKDADTSKHIFTLKGALLRCSLPKLKRKSFFGRNNPQMRAQFVKWFSDWVACCNFSKLNFKWIFWFICNLILLLTP